ncbi:MAG TPA: asparagine synthase (glutamine-hydrolyzing), partial [Dongiaceae bacterium]|nr:asparagine synthase (glutamine-hydrolyzing) [Dongiaceae bacterium]
MCGIAGFVSIASHDSELIVRMTTPIRHRGPDDEGYVIFSDAGRNPLVCGGADTPANAYAGAWDYSPVQSISSVAGTPVTMAFGHRRLSIVDLSPLGHQPMSYSNARYWITYNGEIYNHVELRAELGSLGHRFSSHADTEVLLAAYAQWGEQCLHRLNGMWAFAILDRLESTLFIARDRFGVKPLYYWISPEGLFAFASEIKQFIELPGWQARINAQRTYDFLVFGLTDHTHETMFDGLFQLKPGHCMKIDLKRIGELAPNQAISTQSWYVLKAAPFIGTFEDACEKFRQTFMDSVKLRLRADVPVGSCLSGGLDSSSIVCMMNELLSQQEAPAIQKTFSACTDVERYNERKWIDIVVDETGVDAHYVYPSLENLFEESDQITWHQDEPFGSTSIYAQWNVFKLASVAGVKVMLDGQGADEYLAGYHGFFGARLAGLFKELRWIELMREALSMRRIHAYSLSTSLKFLANHILPHGIADALKQKIGHTHSTPSWLNLQALPAEPVDPKYATGAREGSLYTLSLS